jgi:hypothetical protein
MRANIYVAIWSGGGVVRWSFGQVVIWSGGHLVRWSFGQVVRWSGGHLVILSFGHFVILSAIGQQDIGKLVKLTLSLDFILK